MTPQRVVTADAIPLLNMKQQVATDSPRPLAVKIYPGRDRPIRG
jgi:hypothetical protein